MRNRKIPQAPICAKPSRNGDHIECTALMPWAPDVAQ
jgi:hypothetical protein